MIKNWLVTGDCHGDFSRFAYLDRFYEPEETGIIVLGDGSTNYYLNKGDIKTKKQASLWEFHFYFVRGNHEARPENIPTMKLRYDADVNGNVWKENDFPLLNYLQDGEVYHFGDYKTLVIGGAYSVDKPYRLMMNYQWFVNEQLNPVERKKIADARYGDSFDLVLTHTCPLSWEPTDLFMSSINQTTVDQSTEQWLEEVKDNIQWRHWLFGHFHDDRIMNDNVDMLFKTIVNLNDFFVGKEK